MTEFVADRCHLCLLELSVPPISLGGACQITCRRCGKYAISDYEAAAFLDFTRITSEQRPILSEWVLQRNKADQKPPLILLKDLAEILARHRFTFAERVQRLLLHLLEETSGQPGRDVDTQDYKIHAVLQTFDDVYVGHLVKYLADEKGLLIGPSMPAPAGNRGVRLVSLTPHGVMRAEELVHAHTGSTQGFVAMWFDQQMNEAWSKGFGIAIEAAGYRPQRIDKIEHANKICDEIIAEIRRSRFVVADFTGQRGGVYYEAGYAAGRDIPVIWTCRKDQMPELHFDIRQYNCIDWENPQDLAQRLQLRIEAVIGGGPFRSP